MNRCEYCSRINPSNAFECVGCGAPLANLQAMELAPFYVLTVHGRIDTAAAERLRKSVADISPALAARLIICDDRTSIAPLR